MINEGTYNTANLPQADRLEKVRKFVELVDRSATYYAPLAQKSSERHTRYYLSAASSLGLIELAADGELHLITDRGTRLLASLEGSVDEAVCFRQGIEMSLDFQPLHGYLLYGESLSTAELATFLSEKFGLMRSTAERRAQTLHSWRQYLDAALGKKPQPPREFPAQLDLLSAPPPQSDSLQWPPIERFPRNESRRHRVQEIVVEDLRASEHVLIITGYTSLEYLLDYLEKVGERPAKIRVAFGVEPPLDDPEGVARHFQAKTIVDAMRDYWLRRGISVLSCHAVLHTLSLLDNGRLQVRVSPIRRSRVHAKIYISERAATLGSSNFSAGGMTRLTEVNARFEADKEPERYRETVAFAEKTWHLTKNCNDAFRKLLMRLVKPVSWKEALARAAAALLEGEWASDQIRDGEFVSSLWPSQVQGIKQALWLVENVGNVVIADATGSGKTRMGAQLIRCLYDRQRTRGALGEATLSLPVVICPPAVIGNWKDELANSKFSSLEVYSHGSLSNRKARGRTRILRAISQASLLAVDEAHNFHNPRSQRSAALLSGTADQNLLFTATPVNRDAQDLLSIVEILGADNLDDETLILLQDKLWRPRSRPLELGLRDRKALRAAIRQFMVRRTKRMFNELVDREPEAYRNRQGNLCRYPHSSPEVYSLEESPEDCARADKIRTLAHQLRGVLLLRKPIVLSNALRSQGLTEERLCHMRLQGAAGLAAHHITATLRSSRAALYEHLHGTKSALAKYNITDDFKNSRTGDQLGGLGKLRGNAAPQQPLAAHLPLWLKEPAEYAAAVEEEERIYRQISELCEALSGGREQAKVDHLRRLLDAHPLVLAFDSIPITLGYLRQLLLSTDVEVLLATGDARSSKDRRLVEERFALGASGHHTLALCSDALAEGINLQQGSAVVHLDMPSVIRIAEQRVGRIDRMDSPHANIEIWWPNDNTSFALRTDEKIFARSQLVSSLIGGNLQLPPQLKGSAPVVSPRELIEEFTPDPDDDLDDAFAPVRRLVSGSLPLISPEYYDSIRTSKVQVLAYVASFCTDRPFLFATISIGKSRVPRWVFITDTEPPRTSLDSVAAALRKHLPGAEPRDFDEAASDQLNRWLQVLAQRERELLPPRKRRALKLLEEQLQAYGKRASREKEFDRFQLIADLKERFKANGDGLYFDPDLLASVWLEVLRPRIVRALEERRQRRRRPFRLDDLRTGLKKSPLSDAELKRLIDRTPPGRPLRNRVVAAIVGVPSEAGNTAPEPRLDLPWG